MLAHPQRPLHLLQQPLRASDIANKMDIDPFATEGATKKKRKSEANVDFSAKIKKREPNRGKHCHQCHQHRDSYVECTVLRSRGKKTERCGKIFWYVDAS